MMNYKFLIYISYSYALPIGMPLEAEILKRGFSVKWFSDRNEGKRALKNKTNALLAINDVIDYEPHIVLTISDNVADFISGLKVQVFHGFNAQKRPSKKNTFSHFRIRGFFDLYCTQGPSTTKGFLAQSKKYPHFEVIETGWPKVDPLFPIITKEKTKTPVILIASTFTERLSLAYDDLVLQEIKRLSTTGAYKFMMVLHPKLPTEIKAKWKALNNENFKYYDTTDLVPLFTKSDLMFADTTSAIQEFLLQKKPVVAYNHTFKHDYLIHVNEASQIEKTLDEAYSYPSNLLENMETFIQELHPYFDGESSKRVIDASITFLHQDKSHLQKKPLNLIRKYKIRKDLNYFTLKSDNSHYTIKKQE